MIELNQRGTRVHDGSDSDSDSGSNSRPEDNSKEQRPNPSKKYQHMSELRRDMRDALRVNKNSHCILLISLLIIILFLARFVLESSKVTTGISTRHREDF